MHVLQVNLADEAWLRRVEVVIEPLTADCSYVDEYVDKCPEAGCRSQAQTRGNLLAVVMTSTTMTVESSWVSILEQSNSERVEQHNKLRFHKHPIWGMLMQGFRP